ncbi:ATP-citrate synthase-like isoform X2 [Convolutriloba macropyga]|uniref:ATP-citrate synthase-like isoform X2 n=1 Tax=Convolutriloba macropyga TaxID=536237 RepID=UPI003F51B0B9
MSAKAISEVTGKDILFRNTNSDTLHKGVAVPVYKTTDLQTLPQAFPWLLTEQLVVKPDQLIKRRGKLGLLLVNKSYDEVKVWIDEKRGKTVTAGKTTGVINNFIIEPFLPHKQEEEYYLCIHSSRDKDEILFYHEGGIDIGDVDSKAKKMDIPIKFSETPLSDISTLVSKAPAEVQPILSKFIIDLYDVYRKLCFTYLEINPLVLTNGKVHVLDLAAKLDQTAEFLCKVQWGDVIFPPPFGREAFPEENYIAELDAKSGASLKLTVLNEKGRIWTMVAGGGASVIYSDTICDLGGASELANYGEYSGAPTEGQTYEYAKTVLSLMTKHHHPEGKVLIIGGGIANFTNVAATFKGIIKALTEYKEKLKAHKISIFVRRGGPNYQEGLRVMREVGNDLGIAMHVFGTETHMTGIVSMALKKSPVPQKPVQDTATASFLLGTSTQSASAFKKRTKSFSSTGGSTNDAADASKRRDDIAAHTLFDEKSTSIIWGMQPKAVQGMLDFDYICSRSTPSVAAMTYPFSGDHKQKFYFGHEEILMPLYKNMADAMRKHPEADTLISFASLRSAYDSAVEAMSFPQIRTVAIIAEGIPENQTRKLIKLAEEKGVRIIGPATVGGIKPGCFKIGHTGGMIDNVVASKLYRAGSVAYVSRSGGMSNELNNIICKNTNGVYEGVAIGGDRYPGTTFLDHIIRYEQNEEIKIIVILGEVGGVEEYVVGRLVKEGKISKPIVAWCIGTCASMFNSDVQFGHAGASAHNDSETAVAKNKFLKEMGCRVPESFDSLGVELKAVFDEFVANGQIEVLPEVPPPTVPMDYSWARELGLIRKPASFMSSICDERGDELMYAGMPISSIINENLGIGGVLGLLWFQRRLPEYAFKYLEICLMVTADHGPAVSGAHNTIVCSRAGKDLVSSLTSGLLTIGERFGGALDLAAKQFTEAYDSGMHPNDFVNNMRKKGQLIMGIGHRVKSLNNPDKRTEIIKEYVRANFPSTPLLDYALKVEKITTSKKPNLILNVDGTIAVTFVDLMRGCGCFTREEAQEFIDIGVLNGLFVLGRSVGFIGHFLDQKRLKQGLYRHPWDDITYVLPEHTEYEER